jgi:hypothetical protein
MVVGDEQRLRASTASFVATSSQNGRSFWKSTMRSWFWRTILWVAVTLPLLSVACADDFPWVDLNDDEAKQTIVDRESGQYLGHPTTLLLEDGKTILCVYPKGHGKGAIVFKKSLDGGLSWSDRLPTPPNWATSQETPTLHRVTRPDGQKRILLFSGLHPIRQAISDDDGQTWSELVPIGPWGGIVAMASVLPIGSSPGHYLALFHDDGRYFHPSPSTTQGRFTLYQTRTEDAGTTWSEPEPIFASSEIHLCEPGAIVSPDGRQIAVMLRENRRLQNSHIIFSGDEGRNWSEPRQLPDALTGDRHTAKYAPDGRLFVSFRDVPKKGTESPTRGDWVAWVGTFDDLVAGRDGSYRIRLKKNTKGSDCAYPGVEVLPDGTIVTTTYGHWTAGAPPYILSVQLRLQECDARLSAGSK